MNNKSAGLRLALYDALILSYTSFLSPLFNHVPSFCIPLFERFRGFLEGKKEEYILAHKPEEIVRDFIAGMTDQFFIHQAPEAMRPRVHSFN